MLRPTSASRRVTIAAFCPAPANLPAYVPPRHFHPALPVSRPVHCWRAGLCSQLQKTVGPACNGPSRPRCARATIGLPRDDSLCGLLLESPLNELQSAFGEQVMRVILRCLPMLPQQECRVVLQQMLRIIVVCVSLAEESEPFIETLPRRVAGRSQLPQRPFANQPRAIAGALQDLGDGEVLAAAADPILVVARARMARDSPSSVCSAMARNGCPGVALREPHSFRGQGRGSASRSACPVTAQVPVAKIIRQDKQNVRLAALCLPSPPRLSPHPETLSGS